MINSTTQFFVRSNTLRSPCRIESSSIVGVEMAAGAGLMAGCERRPCPPADPAGGAAALIHDRDAFAAIGETYLAIQPGERDRDPQKSVSHVRFSDDGFSAAVPQVAVASGTSRCERRVEASGHASVPALVRVWRNR